MSLHDYFFLISWELIWQFLALFLEQLQFYSERIYLCLYLVVYPLIFPRTVSKPQYIVSDQLGVIFCLEWDIEFVLNLLVIISMRYLYHLFKTFFQCIFSVLQKLIWLYLCLAYIWRLYFLTLTYMSVAVPVFCL